MLLILTTLISLSYAENADAKNELRNGMWALEGWALGNISVGLTGSLQSTDPLQSSFHQMNAGWNVINAGLATGGLLSKKPMSAPTLKKIFLINAGLDLGYVLGGALLRQQGIKENDVQKIGWGNSIMLQGSFLFAFDGVMGWRMSRYPVTL